jgi:hypothetical protein
VWDDLLVSCVVPGFAVARRAEARFACPHDWRALDSLSGSEQVSSRGKPVCLVAT